MTVNREDLKAFIDGELPVMQTEAIRHEMENNGALAQEVTFLKLIGQGVRDCSQEVPVRGADEALQMFRKKKRFPLLELGVAMVCTVVISAVVFPVFAQSKAASKKTMAMSMAKNRYLGHVGVLPMESADDGVSASVASPAVPSDEMAAKRMPARHEDFQGQRENQARARAQNGLSVTNSSSDDAKLNLYPLNKADKVLQQSPSPVASPADANRMVVQNGDLDEVVKDVSSAQNDAMNYVKAQGGYVQSSSLAKTDADLPQANLNVKVPARNFAMAMDHFKSLAIDTAHIKAVNVTGEDVTARYADTTAKVKVLGAEEDSYITMLRSAKRLGDVLSIKDRLSNVRQQIESLKSESEALKNQSDLSTISLTFEQLPPKVNPVDPTQSSWSSESWTSAINGLEGVLQFLGSLAIYLLVFSPIWVPLGLIGFWLYRRNR